ncbi:MAG: signal peptidase II [Eubacteriales bacterium]
MIYIFIISIVIWIDLYSKRIAKIKLKDKRCQKLFGKFYLCLAYNTGAAYGLFKHKPNFLKILIGVTIILLSLVLFTGIMTRYDPWISGCLSFILGGALGNYIDRIKNGGVTDFLYIKSKHFPIFNIADLFILFPSIILLVFHFHMV